MAKSISKTAIARNTNACVCCAAALAANPSFPNIAKFCILLSC